MYHSLSLGQREETSSVWQSGGYYHIKSYHNIPVWLCLTVTRMPSISLSSLPSGPLSLSLRLSFPLVRYELRVWWIPYHWCVMGWEPLASSNLKCSLFFITGSIYIWNPLFSTIRSLKSCSLGLPHKAIIRLLTLPTVAMYSHHNMWIICTSNIQMTYYI